MAYITTYFNGKHLYVHKEVADLNKIQDGHIIKSQAEFLKILSANVEHGIDRCKQLIDAKKPKKQS